MGTKQQEAKVMKLQDLLQKNTRMVYVSDVMYVSYYLPYFELGSEVKLLSHFKDVELGSGIVSRIEVLQARCKSCWAG